MNWLTTFKRCKWIHSLTIKLASWDRFNIFLWGAIFFSSALVLGNPWLKFGWRLFQENVWLCQRVLVGEGSEQQIWNHYRYRFSCSLSRCSNTTIPYAFEREFLQGSHLRLLVALDSRQRKEPVNDLLDGYTTKIKWLCLCLQMALRTMHQSLTYCIRDWSDSRPAYEILKPWSQSDCSMGLRLMTKKATSDIDFPKKWTEPRN